MLLRLIANLSRNAKLQEYLYAKATPEQILAEIMILESKLSAIPNENGKEVDRL